MKIKFYPFSEKTMDFAPEPMPASKSIPAWYKAQPAEILEKTEMLSGNIASTVKKCMPIFDAMTAGYIIYTPCDIYLDATDEAGLKYSVPAFLKQFQADLFATHAPEQYSEYPLDKSKNHKDLLRVMPFWSVGTDKGYSTLFIQPLHGDSSPLTVIPGIIDTDSFISEGHFSFMVNKNFKGVIKQGTPIVQVIPFKRDSWEMEIESPENSIPRLMKQRLKIRSTFANGYKNKMRFKKEYK
jgi:hypothetical protein